MQIANARLRLNKFGSDVPMSDMTPAEAVVLHVLHQANNGGSTFGEEFEKISILTGEATTQTGMTEEQVIPAVEAVAAKPAVGEVGKPEYVAAVAATPAKPEQIIPAKPILRARTDLEELKRLTAKYGRNVNKKGDRIVKLIWPEMNPKLPAKFSDIDYKNLGFDGIEVGTINYATGTPLATK